MGNQKDIKSKYVKLFNLIKINLLCFRHCGCVFFVKIF
jgi:hypothetical protein